MSDLSVNSLPGIPGLAKYNRPNRRSAGPDNSVQMPNTYGPMIKGLMGQIQDQIDSLSNLHPALTQANPELAFALNRMPPGMKQIAHAPTLGEMEAYNIPNIAWQPNQYDQQAAQARAGQAGASAGIGYLQQHPFNPIAYREYSADPYPGLSLPQTPTRPAPTPNPIAQGLAALGGFIAPSYAGQINAAPLEAARQVSQMQYEDRQRQYQQALEQAQLQHSNAVAARQAAFNRYAYNEGNRQRLGEYNNQLTAQDRSAFSPLVEQSASSGSLANDLPAMSALQRVGNQAQLENSLMDKYAQAQQQLYGMGIQRTQALDNILARILGIQQQGDYHAMLSQYYGGRLQNTSDANDIRAVHDANQDTIGAGNAATRKQNADTNAKVAQSRIDLNGVNVRLRQIDSELGANKLMMSDPTISKLFNDLKTSKENADKLGQQFMQDQATGKIMPEMLPGAENSVRDAWSAVDNNSKAFMNAIQQYKKTHTPNTIGRTTGPNPPAPKQASRYGPGKAGAPVFDPNAPVIK